MDARQKRRALYKTWKKGYYHLCTDGWKDGLLFYDESEYVNAVNIISLLDLLFPIKVHAYEVMRNHLHLLLSGRGIHCVKAFDYMKMRIAKRLREDGHPPLPRNYDFRLVPVEDETQMRRNLVYIARNAFEVQEMMPGAYLWGSSMLHYSSLPRLFDAVCAGEYSNRALQRMFRSELSIPPDRLIHPGLGMALPQGFVDLGVFYKVFPTAKEYSVRLVKDYESYVQLADQIGETITFTDEEAEDIVEQELAQAGQTLAGLSPDDRCRWAVLLHRKYHLAVPMLSRLLSIPARVIDQALRSKRWRA